MLVIRSLVRSFARSLIRALIGPSHGSVVRALLKQFDHLDNSQIEQLNVPTGIPLVVSFDENMNALNHHYLADDYVVAEAIARIKNQVK